jgi:hypothetical protein
MYFHSFYVIKVLNVVVPLLQNRGKLMSLSQSVNHRVSLFSFSFIHIFILTFTGFGDRAGSDSVSRTATRWANCEMSRCACAPMLLLCTGWHAKSCYWQAHLGKCEVPEAARFITITRQSDASECLTQLVPYRPLVSSLYCWYSSFSGLLSACYLRRVNSYVRLLLVSLFFRDGF